MQDNLSLMKDNFKLLKLLHYYSLSKICEIVPSKANEGQRRSTRSQVNMFSGQPVLRSTRSGPNPFWSKPVLVQTRSRSNPFLSKPVLVQTLSRPNPFSSKPVLIQTHSNSRSSWNGSHRSCFITKIRKIRMIFELKSQFESPILGLFNKAARQYIRGRS